MGRHGLAAVAAILAAGLLAAPAVVSGQEGGEPAAGRAFDSPASVYVVRATQCVLFDTRPSQGGSGAIGAGATKTFVLTGDLTAQGGEAGCVVDPGADGYHLNLVAIGPAGRGNLKAWPASAPEPNGGIVNYAATSTMNNSNAFHVANDPGGVKVKANGASVQVRGVLYGTLVDGGDIYADEASVAALEQQVADLEARVEALELPFSGTGCLVVDPGGIDDGSFGEVAWQGAQRAADEIAGVTVSFLESPSAAYFRPNIDAFVNGDCGVIITVGFLLADVTADAAKDNPSQDFAIVDVAVGDFPPWCIAEPLADGTCGGNFVANVRGSSFQTDESSFLAGYLSAGMSATGAVGTFGGLPIPAVTIFMDGYVWGVEHYNGVKTASVQALGWDPDTQTGLFTNEFGDPDLGWAFAEDLVSQGADVVFPVAGPTGLGAAEYCQDTGSCVMVGVDTDQFLGWPQFGDVWLTSVVKGLDLFVYDTIENEALDGSPGGEYVGTLANGGTDIAPYHDFEGVVPEALKDEVDQLRQDIIDGVVVPGP